MEKFIYVGLGGFLGAVMRYSVGTLLFPIAERWQFPLATLCVNCVGCFIMGIVATYFTTSSENPNEMLRIFLMIGMLGAFTTYSAFSYETLLLAQQSRFALGVLNAILHLVGGWLFVFLGMKACQSLY
ncbi:MAG: fluoride efflux transporter CrcB [Bdellovibrionales bacterium]|nr:fluoride efflux transporter CrcB [Bdellovibrionales bacterium]